MKPGRIYPVIFQAGLSDPGPCPPPLPPLCADPLPADTLGGLVPSGGYNYVPYWLPHEYVLPREVVDRFMGQLRDLNDRPATEKKS